MTTKVLFLDFDGPVIPMRGWAWNRSVDKERWKAHNGEDAQKWVHLQKMDPCAVYVIRDALDKTGAKLVISSSWRRLGRDRIVEVLEFNEFPSSFLHDDWRTSVESEEPLDHPSSHLGRPERIRNWLKNHPEITNWCWLDDMNMDLPNGVHVSTWDGLMYNDHRKLCSLLGHDPYSFLDKKEPKEEKGGDANDG